MCVYIYQNWGSMKFFCFHFSGVVGITHDVLGLIWEGILGRSVCAAKATTGWGQPRLCGRGCFSLLWWLSEASQQHGQGSVSFVSLLFYLFSVSLWAKLNNDVEWATLTFAVKIKWWTSNRWMLVYISSRVVVPGI